LLTLLFCALFHVFSNFSFSDVHVEAAGVIAELAQKHEVDRFIQVSALNATVDSPSRFLSTKVRIQVFG